MTKKKTKIKEIKFQMEFNPGMKKFEPVLPLRKSKENIKQRIDSTFDLIMIIILMIVGLSLLIYLITKLF